MLSTHPTISESFAHFLQKALKLDLSPIAYQLMQAETGPHWTKPQTVRAIAHYLAFLYLADHYSRLQLVPSLEIDQVWHYHILDTSKYLEDCQMLFGHVIHHFPYLGLRGEQDQQNQSRAYALTQVLLAKYVSVEPAQDVSPSDCEPMHLERVVNAKNYSPTSERQSRPRLPITMEEVLINIQPIGSQDH